MRVLPTLGMPNLSRISRLVAQICNLRYRRFSIGAASTVPARFGLRTLRRLQTCDTADCESAPRRANAFTLIEFILVMGLLAVVIAIAAPTLSNFFRGRKLDSEARRFVALARYGQSQAVSDGVPKMLWLDCVDGTYGLRELDGFNFDTAQAQPGRSRAQPGYEKVDSKEPTFRLAQNLRFELAGANSRTNGRVVTIRFLPDGSIDEAALQVLKLLQEDPEKRREPQTIWIAQSWDNTRYEIVDQTNAWQKLSLETSLQGGLYTR